MTTFILHGGGEGQGGVEHDGFFKEIIGRLPTKSMVLCVYFAVPDALVQQKHKVYVDFFERNNELGKRINLVVASKDDFMTQLQKADAVYFRGGDTLALLSQIKKYENFAKELLKKDIVAGSSAGVYFLSQASYSASRNVVYEGLGILPIKANCHHNANKDLSKLDAYPGELVTIKEGEYKIMKK